MCSLFVTIQYSMTLSTPITCFTWAYNTSCSPGFLLLHSCPRPSLNTSLSGVKWPPGFEHHQLLKTLTRTCPHSTSPTRYLKTVQYRIPMAVFSGRLLRQNALEPILVPLALCTEPNRSMFQTSSEYSALSTPLPGFSWIMQ